MQSVPSKDGTAVAFARSGTGPATFFREVVRAPEAEIEMLRSLPGLIRGIRLRSLPA